MRYLWLLTPDALALLVFLFALARSRGESKNDLASRAVSRCIQGLGVRKVDVDKRDGIAELVRDEIHSESLTEMTIVSGFISIAGAIETAAVHNAYEAVLWALPIWLIVMICLLMTRMDGATNKKEARRRRLVWCVVFVMYTILAIAVKVFVVYAVIGHEAHND